MIKRLKIKLCKKFSQKVKNNDYSFPKKHKEFNPTQTPEMYSSSISSSYSSPSSPSRYGRSSSAMDRSSAVGTSTLSGSRYSSSGLLSGRSEDSNDLSSSNFRRGGTYSSSNGYERIGSAGSSGYRYVKHIIHHQRNTFKYKYNVRPEV